MEPSIKNLKSTTFSGRQLTREQILDIKETVKLVSSLSRKKLCRTICEHLNWVKVKYLASARLTMTTRQLRQDWFENHVYCPVLCEPFVDESRFSGTCHRAANWFRIGATSGRKDNGRC